MQRNFTFIIISDNSLLLSKRVSTRVSGSLGKIEKNYRVTSTPPGIVDHDSWENMVTCIRKQIAHGAAANDETAANVLIHHTMQMNEQVNYAFRVRMRRLAGRRLPTSIRGFVPIVTVNSFGCWPGVRLRRSTVRSPSNIIIGIIVLVHRSSAFVPDFLAKRGFTRVVKPRNAETCNGRKFSFDSLVERSSQFSWLLPNEIWRLCLVQV